MLGQTGTKDVKYGWQVMRWRLTSAPPEGGTFWAMKAHAKNGQWQYRLQLGDWVALDAEEGSYFGATPLDVTSTAFYAYSARLMAKVAALLNKPDDAAEFAAVEQEARDAFIRHYFTANGDMTVQTQTAHILTLHFHLVPDMWARATASNCP